jgi:TPR repeat protein
LILVYCSDTDSDDFNRIGQFFEYGTGVRRNYETAKYWYNRVNELVDDLD